MKKKRKKLSAPTPVKTVSDSAEQGMRREGGWRERALVYVFLAGVSLAVFGQVYGFDFINYDDDKYVTANPHVQEGLTLESVRWAFTSTYFLNWHPLTWLSYMADCQLFGLNAGGHHLVNVMIHVVNALLLFEILRRMTHAPWRSALVAALFAIHPLHVQPVAWISSRKDVLSTLFWLVAMLNYCAYAKRPTVRRYALVLVPFALGLMAKSMLVTLPCTLLLLDFWPLGRFAAGASSGSSAWSRGTRLLIEKLPLFAFSVAAGIIASVVMVPGMFPFGVRVSNALVSYVTYIRMAFWPARLAVFYPHAGATMPVWQPVGAAVLLLGVSVLAVMQYRRRPYLIMGWLWYLGTLAPVIGIVDIAGAHAMADRYTYVPLMGLSIACVWGAADLAQAWHVPKAATAVASAILIAVLTILSVIEAGHWRNSQTLFTRALEVTDVNPVAHNNLGLVLAGQGRKDEALAHYRKAAQELDGILSNPVAHMNLASALQELGKTDEAIAEYANAIEMDPACVQAHNNLGAILASRGAFPEAVRHYEEVVRLNPADASAHSNLATALAGNGMNEKAIEHFREAIRLDPGNIKAHYNLAGAFTSQGKLNDAIAEYMEVVRLDTRNVDAYVNLGVAKAMQKKFDEALAFYGKAAELDPGNLKVRQDVRTIRENLSREVKPDDTMARCRLRITQNPNDVQTRMDLARLLVAAGRLDESVEQYLDILKIEPSNRDAYFNLGLLNAARGKRDDAIACLKKVLELDPNDAAAREALERLNAGRAMSSPNPSN